MSARTHALPTRLRSTFGPGRPLLAGAALLALCAFAYRPLLLGELAGSGDDSLARWITSPEEKAPLLVLAVAGWLLWRRRERLRALPRRPSVALSLVVFAIAGALFVWAHLTRSTELLFPSLAANLLAFAAASRGVPGLRAVLLPAVTLLFAVPIPAPLRHEIVWTLQVWTAHATAATLQALGIEAVLNGVVIHSRDYFFVVIESCSGLRGIEILTLGALVIRELFVDAGRREWVLLAVAPCLGFGLNVVRVVVVILGTDAPGQSDHTPHGIAVLVAGAVILYGLGFSLAGRAPSAPPRPQVPPLPRQPARRLLPAGSWLALLALLSVTLTPGVSDRALPRVEIPERLEDWVGEDLSGEPLFTGFLRRGPNLYRRYERQRGNRPMVVDLFVGAEVPGDRASSGLFSSRLAVPGGEWSIGESEPVRLWVLGIDAEMAVATRDEDLALVYTWRLRDPGLLAESARAALALESGPLGRERPRVAVRLATRIHAPGPVAREQAKRTLDRFLTTFREPLADL